MENIPENEDHGTAERYVPRPAWQVWAARIGLAAFIVISILYYCRLMGGGA